MLSDRYRAEILECWRSMFTDTGVSQSQLEAWYEFLDKLLEQLAGYSAYPSLYPTESLSKWCVENMIMARQELSMPLELASGVDIEM